MTTIDLSDFAEGGIIREASFREKLSGLDLESMRGRRVFIKGCAEMVIPTWAFMMVAASVAQVADTITFGEIGRPTVIFRREKSPVGG